MLSQQEEHMVSDVSSAVEREEPANEQIIRRNIRTNAFTGGQTKPQQGKPPSVNPPIFWLSPHSYPPGNGVSIPTTLSEEETMRSHVWMNGDSASTALRPFSALIGQKSENDAGPAVSPFRVKSPIEYESDFATAFHRPNQISQTCQIYSGLAGTIAIGLGAAVMAILAFQLLISLNYYESPTLSGVQLTDSSTPQILRDLSLALCSITLTFSLCAIMSSFLHFYLCMRIINHSQDKPDWKERMSRYQQRSMYMRALSNGGFFISIILYMLAFIAYQQLLGSIFGSIVSAVVVTVVFGLGSVFCIVMLISGLYFADFCKEIRSVIKPNSEESAERRGTLV